MKKEKANIQKQYRLVHDVYLLMDYGDTLVLDEFKLTSSQMNILSLLNLEHGQRLTDISLAVFRSKSTITRAVDQLEARKLVERVPDAEDRRAQLVVLTEKGKEFRVGVTEKLLVSLDERFKIIDEDEMDALLNIMTKLRDGLTDRFRTD